MFENEKEVPVNQSDTGQAPPQFNFFYKYGGQKEGDATLELFLSTDEMFLIGHFLPPKDNGKLLVADEIEASLTTLGIAHGIQSRTVYEAVYQCNMNHRTLNDIILARGTPPKKSRPAYLRLETRLFAGAYPQESDIKNVDMKSYSKLVIVKKGELLARAIHAQDGENGFTVKGDPIPYGKKDVKFLKPGPHTLFVRGKVFAKVPGQFVVTKDIFDISNTLEIEGDVDYAVGHINFPGDVTIGGRVLEGFHIVCGGNLTLKGPLDASQVYVKGNLTAGGGIFGKGPAVIRVGGDVNCHFIENCHLEALGSVHGGKELLNAHVYTNGALQLAEGGKIVNTTLWAKGPVIVQRIGNDTTRSHLVVGTDFVIHRRVEVLRQQFREEEDKQFKLRERLRGSGDGSEAGLKEVQDCQNKMDALIGEINSLLPSMIHPDSAALSVKGEIWPGTVLEMGYARMDINETQAGKTYKLSADGRTITVEKYTPPETTDQGKV